MRRGRTWWLAIGVCAVLVAAALVALARPSIGPSPAGSSSPVAGTSVQPSIGPVVYYEVLDADAARLLARTLDGRSLPREVASRIDANGPAWTVDPTGSIAVAITADAALGPGLVGVDTATGAQLWAAPTKAAADIVSDVWSSDGRQMAALLDDPDPDRREIVIVDATTGAVRFPAIPDDADLQGFTPDGALILRRHVVDEASLATSWRFLRIEPTGLTAVAIPGLPDVQPAGDGYEAAAPRVHTAVDQGVAAGGAGVTVRAWDLDRGTSKVIATFPSLDRLVMDPAGTGVAASTGGSVRFVTLGGLASDVFTGADSIADVDWSTAGDYLAVTTDQPTSGLTIVERATGRTVAVPPVEPSLYVRFVAMPGGLPLPPEPLPAAEPTPTPTPGPSGADVTAFEGVLAGWVDGSSGRSVVHAQRLVPTEAGGIRVAADLPPIDLGPVDPETNATPGVALLPRPGSTDVLVVLATTEGSTMSLWMSGGSVEAYRLPADWPADTSEFAWRPDGQAIAASASRPTADGGITPEFVIAAAGDRHTTVIPAAAAYTHLEGWWSATELRVGREACVDICPGRYADSARLRITDRRLTQLGRADRATGAIDGLVIDGDQLVLSAITGETSDDLRIDWPPALGPASAVTPIGSFADARDLLVSRSVGTTTELYRIRDVVGRARDGRLTSPDPVLVASIVGHELEIQVSPDRGWALVTDRVAQVRLVRLADGRVWPLGTADRIFAWAGG
jgi:hypothetical protein